MIQVKRIEETNVEHFDPQGNSLGMLTFHESNWLRLQIARENVTGYYAIKFGNRVDIMSNGTLKQGDMKIDNIFLYYVESNLLSLLDTHSKQK